MSEAKFWRDGDVWCNHCPSCGAVRKFKAKISVDNLTSICRSCDQKRRGRKIPGCAELIREGKIWWDEATSLWNSYCPACNRVKTATLRDNARKYLTSVCRHCTATRINTGRKHSDETKQKKSLALKGEKSPCFGTHLSDEVKRKMSLTTRGIPKSPEHFNKIQESAFKRKTYVFPDGRMEKVQGYEPFTLDHLLLNEQVHPDDIAVQTKDKPVVTYEYEGHQHNYFPDCYVKSTNTIVETKSPYTWESKLKQNTQKVVASVEQGYNVRVLVWDKDGTLIMDILHSSQVKELK